MNEIECHDKNCPIHGDIKIRGNKFIGKVVSDKAQKTVIVSIDYTTYVPKYERYLRKRSRIPAHNPECIKAKKGDLVEINEVRKISKTKSFVVTKIIERGLA